MRKRITAATLAAGFALTAFPAAGLADDADQTCQNGNDPVVYLRVEGQPVTITDVRLLCIQED